MIEGSYGKESFDLRLTALRLWRCFDKILVITLVGTLLFGGGYYVKRVLLRGEILYSAVSTYKVEYSNPDFGEAGTYINAATWNTHVHTEEFMQMVEGHLEEGAVKEALSNPEVWLSADVPSDLRVLTTTVTTPDPQRSLQAAAAVEQALTEDFPKVTTEVSAIRVTDPAREAGEVIPDVRPLRAFGLSAVLSFFFAVILFLLKETGDDSIWLPSLVWKRYGIPILGTIHTKELRQNISYLFRGMETAAVCAVDSNVDPAKAAERLRELTETELQWVAVPTPHMVPEICEGLRKMDGILLVVKAGSHAGKPLEYVLEFLRQQDCKVTAVILWEADELLIKAYYRFACEEKTE